MTTWQPQPEGLGELVMFLRDAGRPDTKDRYYIQQRLDSFRAVSDYNSYLVYILVKMTNEEWYTRQVAGLTLKNNIRGYFNSIPLSVLDYVKSCCCDAVIQPDVIPNIRTAVGSVIAAIITHGQACNWPEILELLVNSMGSPNPLSVEMGFDALGKICEDAARDLDQDINGVRPLNYIIPKFIQVLHHPNPKLRTQAMVTVSQFILLKTQALMSRMNDYLDGLFIQMNDQDPSIRQEICNSLAMILEARPDKLAPVLTTVIEYVILCTHDPNDQVALRACDFWLQYIRIPGIHDQLTPYLSQIIPVLLQRMIYTDTDLLSLTGTFGDDEDDLDDSTIADKDQDIPPRFYRKKHHYHQQQPFNAGFSPYIGGESDSNGDDKDTDDDDDLDDEDFYSEWTLRKSSASTLELLATAYPDQVCKVLVSHLDQTLSQEDWKKRESGILAIGAVAEALKEMSPFLPRMLLYLLDCLNDRKPLIRSITCWVLGRYSGWCIDQLTTSKDKQQQVYFEKVLLKLLERVLDRNKRVQLNACSALAVFFEEARELLIPYLDPILEHLTTAFTIYQSRNLDSLYDTLSTLADGVGGALNHPGYIHSIMIPMTEKWNSLSDRDTGLFPLFQCLSAVTTAIGTGFLQYSESVFARCIKIITATLEENYIAQQQPELLVDPPDAEFIVAALDLLSGMVQGMGSLVSPMVANSEPSLFSLILTCLKEPRTDVLQSTCALIGDLAVSCFDQLQPHLPTLIPLLIQQAENEESDHVSVCSNSIWTLGEIVLRWKGSMHDYIPRILERLLKILPKDSTRSHHHDVSRIITLYDNVVITIGRLGFSSPDITSIQLKHYARRWILYAKDLPENDEKDTAFIGFCQTIKANPVAAEKDFSRFVDVMVSWTSPSEQLRKEFKDLVEGYQQIMKPAQWTRIMKKLNNAR
ncbi:armadillo-type protein [Halteromyces radiatus]|uniref:armadillo-type protein n=1 Tax=Halteromyces radiatus TaxID=101107 RepID=UPI00221FB06F|nr:armadillo-type protein [Halteromyces radiatus]KAI8086186.1 armadillo-type protein [Halteromyces radiatus]